MDVDVELIDSFCERHNLVWCIDTTSIEPIIVGTKYSRLYVFDEAAGKLALEFVPDELEESWGTITRKLLAANFDSVRDSACVSYFAFDADNPEQAALALSIAGVRSVRDSAMKRSKMTQVITLARQRKTRSTRLRQLAVMRALQKAGVYIDKVDFEDPAGYLGSGPDKVYQVSL
jgi:hypothetical protein